ncbi:MAG: histidine phosphatase family protein [Oscillatoriales cyanobacterium]|nr:MAG: histidine phosphatase family protein [Oscillatoriales cyanobacterium]
MAVRIHLNGQWFLGSLALVLSIGIMTATTTSDAATNAQTQAGWQLLQRGETGLVVAMRHAIAPGTGDPANFKLGDCSTQRNLSAQGRTQAQQIGAEFLETAKLINLGKVEPLRTLNSFFSDSSKEARQTATIRKLIVDNRNTKGAVIMVTHQVNITALTNIVPQSGEAVILKSDPQGKIQIVGRIGRF